MYDFESVVDRRGTWSMKWDRYRGRDVIPMWVADMDFRAPPEVIALLRERVEHGIFGYTTVPEELAEVVISHLFTEYRWEVRRDWIVWLPGLVSGLNIACRAVGREGDSVVTSVPVYPPFLTAPKNSRRNLVTVPLLQARGGWKIDFAALEGAITPTTKLLLLCNPHNPVGRSFTREELETVADICERRGVAICSDEIHCGLILDEEARHVPIASLSLAVASRTITLMSPSKTYNLPGLGCAFAVVPGSALRKSFKEAMAGIVPSVNVMGLLAALAAYRQGEPWRRALLHRLRENRDLVERRVAAMANLSVSHAEATYLSWIDAREMDMEDPAAFFETRGVGLSDGKDFGLPGFLRLNFGCPPSLLEKGLERMEGAVNYR